MRKQCIFREKNYYYLNALIFHIEGNLCNKKFGLQQKLQMYSILEVHSVLEYSILEVLLYLVYEQLKKIQMHFNNPKIRDYFRPIKYRSTKKVQHIV